MTTRKQQKPQTTDSTTPDATEAKRPKMVERTANAIKAMGANGKAIKPEACNKTVGTAGVVYGDTSKAAGSKATVTEAMAACLRFVKAAGGTMMATDLRKAMTGAGYTTSQMQTAWDTCNVPEDGGAMLLDKDKPAGRVKWVMTLAGHAALAIHNRAATRS